MKLDRDGSTETAMIPMEEGAAVVKAMRIAGQAGDLVALQWCARRMAWLWECGEEDCCDSGTYCYTDHIFNSAWELALQSDPPPASIADIFRGEEDAPSPAEAEHCLDYLGAYFRRKADEVRDTFSGAALVEGLRGLLGREKT